MKLLCPWCGGELPGEPGQYVKCRHCGSEIHWGGGKPWKSHLHASQADSTAAADSPKRRSEILLGSREHEDKDTGAASVTSEPSVPPPIPPTPIEAPLKLSRREEKRRLIREARRRIKHDVDVSMDTLWLAYGSHIGIAVTAFVLFAGLACWVIAICTGARVVFYGWLVVLPIWLGYVGFIYGMYLTVLYSEHPLNLGSEQANMRRWPLFDILLCVCFVIFIGGIFALAPYSERLLYLVDLFFFGGPA